MSYSKIIWLTFMSIFSLSNQQYVYTHLDRNLQFNTIASPPVRIPVNLGSDFTQTQNYSVWGWFKPTLKFPMISNIITLRNLTGSDAFIRQEFRSSYPDCPLSQDQLAQDQNLLNLDAIRQNPNCFQEKLVEGNEDDILFVNYDLHPKSLDANGQEIQTFDLIFVFKDGRDSMRLEGFQDIPMTDSWVFWAFSADYFSGQITMYMKSFDGFTEPMTKTIQVIFSEFQLKQNALLIVADVQNNKYFDQVAGFVGRIAYIEMSRFYTDNLPFMWIGYASSESQQYNSILIDFYFDIYDQQQPLQNYGHLSQRRYSIQGDYQPLYLSDPNLLGVKFLNRSALILDDVNLSQNNSEIQTALFLMNFEYDETLPNSFIILQRGNKGEKGFLQVSLKLRNNGRVIEIDAEDETNPGNQKDPAVYTSTSILRPNTKYFIMFGVSQNLAGTLRVIYLDSIGGNSFDVIKENADFDFGPLPIILFQQPQTVNYPGSITLYRFIVADSGSPAINYFNKYSIPPLMTLINNSPFEQDRLCLIRSNYYRFDNQRQEEGNCIVCDPNTSIVNQNRMCSTYCTLGNKNAMVNNCQPCVVNTINQDNGEERYCRELDLTHWTYVPVNDTTFKLIPSRRLLNPQIDYPNLFAVYVDGKPKDANLISYTVKPDPDSQGAIFNINFLDDIKGEKLRIDVLDNAQTDQGLDPLYDENRNLMVQNSTGITSVLGEELVRVCYVGDGTSTAMKVLAWILLALYVFTFVLLLIFTIFCWGKYRYGALSGYWKFFLHMWMKLQMVAFFIALAIYMPCCVQEFLKQLYRISVSWDHALRVWINSANKNSQDFQNGINKPIPEQMREVHIRPFILHNMLIFFIIHLAIFVLWLFMKIWDYFLSVKKSCMFYLLNVVEYTLMIVGFLLVLMQIAVFSSLNVRLQQWDHSYFVFCFLISIAYWIVFILFWIWCLYRLLGPSDFWIGTNNGNKYFYFFAGYKDSKMARTYDLWFTMTHFIVGLMIGFLIYHGLAQMIIITIFVVILFFLLIIIRPWKSFWLNLADIISQLCIIVAVIIFLVIAIMDHGSCIACGDREGSLCWVIVMFLWLGLLIGLILLWLAAMLGYYGKKIPEEVKVENYYHNNKQVIYNQINKEEHVNETYINNRSNQYISNTQELRNNQLMTDKQMMLANENYSSQIGSRRNQGYAYSNVHSQDISQTNVNMKEAMMAEPDEVDDPSIQDQILDVMGPDQDDEYSFDQDDYSMSHKDQSRRYEDRIFEEDIKRSKHFRGTNLSGDFRD